MLSAWLARSASLLEALLSDPDPATAVGNRTAALILGSQPFYPLYVFLAASHNVSPVLPSLLTAPFFGLALVISKQYPMAAKALVLWTSFANTLICKFFMGTDSGIDLFVIPCVVLAIILYGMTKTWVVGLAVITAYAIVFLPMSIQSPYSGTELIALQKLNLVSAGGAAGFIVWFFVSHLSRNDRRFKAAEGGPP